MKNSAVAVSGVLAVAVSFSNSALADNHERPDMDPVELYSCTFREGKSMADLDALDARYKQWADRNNKDHSSWRITPLLRSTEGEFHVGYIGSWNDGKAMGAGMDAWAGNTDLLPEYMATIDCDHSLMASATIDAPKGPPKDGIVWFSSCHIQDSASHELAYMTHKKSAAAFREKGGKGQAWLFYPSLGLGDPGLDYYSVVTFNSMKELGDSWEMYYNGGGWKVGVATDAITQCDSPRVYTVKSIRMGPQD
jgi:hypothetical protein